MLGFLVIILIGTLLLMLPVASKEETTFLGALFCSVSATCVTGLVAYDTFTHWTLFGQLVLLVQMQIGGLGFITISTFAMIMAKRKIGLSRRTLIQNSLNTLQIRGGVRLVSHIIRGTLLFEGIGAVLLSIRFVPEMGWAKGIYYGIFHAISAFCNAGFDLMGFREPYSSLTYYYGDPLVILTISALIIIGGIGFIVWEDVLAHRMNFKKYQLHSKVALCATLILLAVGTVLFLILENDGLFACMTVSEKLLAAFFSAVTPRTAGFNSVDTASLSNGSMFLTIILMFIGGSPGSTAGGVKTVTIAVILLSMRAYLRHDQDCVIFRSRIDQEAVKRASMVVLINLSLAVIGIMIIFSVQDLPFTEVMFEVFSAIGTVGMSTGVTRELCTVSAIVIMMLMYLGRMGSLTFAMSFTEELRTSKLRYSKEDIVVG